jgi:alpha-tubulin suppressor-like RCC1 family protein
MSAITARIVGVCIVAACAFGALGATPAGASDTVLAWGENNFGQLGDNSTAASAVPVAVCETNWTGSGACTGHDLTGVEAIASGARQSLALLKTGEVVAWGENNEGELGNGTTVTSHVPVPVCEGPATCPTGPFLTGVREISAGGQHSIALLGNGTVMDWGTNGYGGLGDNSSVVDSDVPVAVCQAQWSSGPCPSNHLQGVVAVSAGGTFDLALLSGGEVVGWGYGEVGSLGDDTTANSPVPMPVCEPEYSGTAPCTGHHLKEAVAIAAGGYQGLALLKSGEVVAWGQDQYGELGDNGVASGEVPVHVCKLEWASGACPAGDRLSGVTSVSAGGYDSYALLSGGEVAAWGRNQNGELGDNSSANSSVPLLTCEVEWPGSGPCTGHPLAGVKSLKAYGAGGYHMLAILNSGKVASWGLNEDGTLGNDTTTATGVPVTVCEVGWLGGPPCLGSDLTHALATSTDGPSLALAEEQPPAQAHWFSNGQLIPEGKPETVATQGTLTFSRIYFEESEVTCRVTDEETIENPVGGAAGSDSLTQVTFSNCFIPSSGPPVNAGLCGSFTPEVIAHHLPWATQLLAGSPAGEEIKGMEVEIKCSNGTVLQSLTGNLTPAFGGGVATFTSTTGTLQQSNFPVMTHVLGTDSFTGPVGDELVTPGQIYPHWYSDGQLIPEGQTEPIATSGTFSVKVPGKAKGTAVVKCKVKDHETIVNPTGGGAGTDELTEFEASGCTATPTPCPAGTKVELIANNLPWLTHLAAGPPITDVIEGVQLEVRCSGMELDFIDESLDPTVGDSVLSFTGTVSATDKLTGPKGDETITAELPGLPHWYSDGKRTAQGEVVPVTTSATLSFRLPGEDGTARCKVKDHETVTNPVGGGAGVDEVQEFVISGCAIKPSPCPGSKLELIARGLSWLTHLLPGPPIADVIEGANVEARCSNGTVLGTMQETLSATVGNSVLDLSSGFMTGSDKLTGPKGDQTITAQVP